MYNRMTGVTGGFDHQPNVWPPWRKATWWSTAKRTSAVKPNVTRTPNSSRHNANAITNPAMRKKRKIKIEWVNAMQCNVQKIEENSLELISVKRPTEFSFSLQRRKIPRWHEKQLNFWFHSFFFLFCFVCLLFRQQTIINHIDDARQKTIWFVCWQNNSIEKCRRRIAVTLN